MQKRSFGKTKDGREVFLFSMENKNGVKAEVTNFGAILVNLLVPDRKGNKEDVIHSTSTLLYSWKSVVQSQKKLAH